MLLIRPKMAVCDDDVYRESRWFITWKKPKTIDQFPLPEVLVAVTEQVGQEDLRNLDIESFEKHP